MAGSRLEKIGSIYTRTTGLLRTGALNWEDRPLWYDVYEAFPPKTEPKYDNPIPNMKLKQIFYKEDKIRALFHKNNKQIGRFNMFNTNYQSLTQRFIETYQKLEAEYAGSKTESQLYQEAIDILKRDRDSKENIEEEETVSLSTAFKQAKSSQKVSHEQPAVKVDVTNIFKD